jgi:hypothetical protein
MLQLLRPIFIYSILLTTVVYPAQAEQISIGWAEEVIIGNSGFQIEAKIDTGADNSSINAVDPEHYTKKGREWVKFSVHNDHGREIVIDSPVVRRTEVKTKSGGMQPRVVIEIDVCLASVRKRVPVNLIDRSHFKYQVLIGRSFLSPDFLVDSGRQYTVEPKCQ